LKPSVIPVLVKINLDVVPPFGTVEVTVFKSVQQRAAQMVACMAATMQPFTSLV